MSLLQAEPEGSRSRLVNRYNARLRAGEDGGGGGGGGGGRPPALPSFPDPGLAETRLAARGKAEQASELRRSDSGQRRLAGRRSTYRCGWRWFVDIWSVLVSAETSFTKKANA